LRIRLIPLLSIIIVFLSCAHHPERGVYYTPPPGGDREVLLQVPLFPQKRFHCGPAALAGVMNYWNVGVTPEEIARALSTDRHRGTLSLDLYLYAKKRGLKVELLRGGMKALIRSLDGGYPVIVMVDSGMGPLQKNHFMVVVGYNGKGLFVNTQNEREIFFSYAEMDRIWRRTNYWGLLVYP